MQDGHGPGLKAIIKKEQMSIENELKVLAMKHASSTSGVTQSADIGRQFANVKEGSKTTTAENLPHGFGLKGYLEDIFDQKKACGELILKLPTRKAIIDHAVSCPEIFSKAMAPKTTKRGFIENGMIDSQLHLYPDMTKMLQTCKSEIKQEHEDLLLDNFSELYKLMKIEGNIKEEVYDCLGFPQDTDYSGAEVDKPDSISQETRHRAKVLSPSLQRDL